MRHTDSQTPLTDSQQTLTDTMTAIWDAMRAIDVLQALAEVHGERIGVLGDALEGRLAMVLAALDQ